MKKNEREESLGTRLKGYEKDFESRIDAEDFIVCRIDGHKFSKYTKGMRKPFDKILSKTMKKTTEDLVEKFGAVTGYTQSDEITLIFAPQFSIKLKPISYKDIQIGYGMCDIEIPEYRVYDREDNYVGVVDTNFEEDEEGYYINTYYISDDDGNNIDTCTDQGRNPQTRVKTEAMFDKYLIKEVKIINEQIFGGRIQKMASLIASFTSMRFNIHFEELILKDMDKYDYKGTATELKGMEDYWLRMRAKVGNAWFDARLYGVDCPEEAYNSLMWRIRDAEKNSRSMFAQTYCSHKSLLNKNGLEQVEFCKKTTGKDWEEIENKYKYGILVKREEYQKVVNLDDIQTHSDISTVTRTRTVSWAEALTNFSEESVDLICRKLK